MNFESLDGYLLTGVPPKNDVIEALLAARPAAPGAAAFLEGMRRLRERTPDLTLIALRLVLAGKKADDASVTTLRAIAVRAQGGDATARDEYLSLLSS